MGSGHFNGRRVLGSGHFNGRRVLGSGHFNGRRPIACQKIPPNPFKKNQRANPTAIYGSTLLFMDGTPTSGPWAEGSFSGISSSPSLPPVSALFHLRISTGNHEISTVLSLTLAKRFLETIAWLSNRRSGVLKSRFCSQIKDKQQS